jgi:hypothetical protein
MDNFSPMVFHGTMPDPAAPYEEFSRVRLRVPKVDDKGRAVAAGTEGAIVHVHPVPAGAAPAYVVEVVLVDDRGLQCDAHLFDAGHSELELVPG